MHRAIYPIEILDMRDVVSAVPVGEFGWGNSTLTDIVRDTYDSPDLRAGHSQQ